MADPEYFSRPSVCNNPIFRLIRNTPEGEAIKAFYKANGYLVKNLRSCLTRIVIGNEGQKALDRTPQLNGCKQLVEFKITRAHFIYLSHQIQQLLAGENCYTYYTPFKYIDKEKFPASGTLVRHYEYLLKKYRKQNILKPSPPANRCIEDETEIPRQARESLTWLRSNFEPRNEAIHHWQTSFLARQELLVTPGYTTAEYFSELPVLLTSLGAELLQRDFQILFPDSEDFATNWGQAIPQLIQSLKHCKAIPLADRGFLKGIAGMLRHNQDAVLLFLLPYLIDPPAPKRKLQEKKLSAQERQESFFVHVEQEDAIGPALTRLRERLNAAGSGLQPVTVLVGDLVNLNSIYVCMSDAADKDTSLPTMYKVDSVLHAFDLCFKSTFALQCKFQPRATQCWLFIQRALFKITRKNDRPNQSVNILLGLCAPPLDNPVQEQA